MSTQTGTASDYLDLIEKLDLFLTQTGHAWGKTFTGTGTGDLVNYLGTGGSVAETFTITATSATTFTVVGSVSGALASATVGTPYTSAKVAFTINAGGTAFVAGDRFLLNTSPPWQRLARWGCADTRKWASDLNNRHFLLAADGTPATAAATTSFVEFELVVATKVRRLFARATATPTRMPTTFSLEWKDTVGGSWTVAQTFTKSGGWASSEGFMFDTTTDPGAHKFWRVGMSGATGSTEIDSLLLYRDTAGDVLVNARAEWAWQAPGLDGTRAILCSASTAHSEPADRYNIVFQGFRAWDATLPIESQPVNSGQRAMCLGASPCAYWFVVNGQRAMIVTRFGSIYQVAYVGFGLPYEPPSVHQYPMLVGASFSNGTLRYDSTSIEYRFPADPGPETLRAYYPDSTWRSHSNRYNAGGGGTEGSYDTGRPGKVWPGSYGQGGEGLSYIRDNIDASRSILPCVLLCDSPVHAWGEFDGLYWTTGFSTVSESVIRESGFDHLVVQNIFRNGPKDFAAVRLD